ncbi:hypothetical protein BD289DRAFT_176701 [Coniella lustricola]|uniref:Transmembrane protein n=1 Tax=Coniella lustricola TaxID=2025994 RepID=A0A2T2ZTM3_9PEZI|nr:hypothetical protein BD289DRAFT_176701 [Coniella lustricola]
MLSDGWSTILCHALVLSFLFFPAHVVFMNGCLAVFLSTVMDLASEFLWWSRNNRRKSEDASIRIRHFQASVHCWACRWGGLHSGLQKSTLVVDSQEDSPLWICSSHVVVLICVVIIVMVEIEGIT